jgi:hypothetical protein
VNCLLQTTVENCRDIDNPACWFTLVRNTGIELAFQRSILFPELARFPQSIAEEQLLRQGELVDDFPEKDVHPVASILLPADLNDVSLRGLLVTVARLGQLDEMRSGSVTVGQLGDWGKLSGDRNGLLIGSRDELKSLDLPVETRTALSALKDSEGLLAEIISGEPGGVQRRWIVVSGADSVGLVNAILSLGSADALATVTSNPWTVKQEPVILKVTNELSLPLDRAQSFRSLVGGDMVLRGTFRSRASTRWTLPPGYETGIGSKLLLDMSHVGGLRQESAVQFKVNRKLLPGVNLELSQQQNHRRLELPIPSGLPGRDPNTLDVSSYLDIGSTDCSHRNEERAWVSFSSQSALDVTARPLTVRSLDRLGFVLLRDAFLRRALVLLPQEHTAEDLDIVKNVALYLGRNLPSMPILWPEGALYSADKPVSKDLVSTRSVLLLGNAEQWKLALPKDTTLSMSSEESVAGMRIQGKTVQYSDLSDSLVFAQFIDSPWNANDCVAIVGGVRNVGGKTATDLLTMQDIQDRLTGTASGLDNEGRIFSYDTRTAEPHSLASRIQEQIPPGMTHEETMEELTLKDKIRDYLTTRNVIIGVAVLLFVLFMMSMQVRLMVGQTKRRREEKK